MSHSFYYNLKYFRKDEVFGVVVHLLSLPGDGGPGKEEEDQEENHQDRRNRGGECSRDRDDRGQS